MVLFILTTSFFQSERVRICTSHGAATIGGTALLVSKAAAHLVRPRCLVLYCLPIPAPLVLSRRRPHADGSGVCSPPQCWRTEAGRSGSKPCRRLFPWSREAVMSRHALRFCSSTRHIFGYLIQVLIRIINAKFQTIPLRSSFFFALKAK